MSEPAKHNDDLLFEAPCGTIRGWRDTECGVRRATGIPYARSARFEKPQPVLDVQANGQVFDATSWCPESIQGPPTGLNDVYGPNTRELGMSEQCQNLSIILPDDATPGEVLPVIVWVHGGSYTSGSADSSLSDYFQLVKEHRVIVVNVNYRLGLLGYLATAYSPANLGLMDIREAFLWVRRNIASFGGDAHNITALGESAGADAIAHLLAAEGTIEPGREAALANGSRVEAGEASAHDSTPNRELLFDRAILLSPPLGIRTGKSRMTRIMARLVDRILDPHADTKRILQVQGLAGQKVAWMGFAGAMPYGVQYGHEPLPDESGVEAAWGNIAARVPIMIGNVGTESTLFSREVGALNTLRTVPVIGKPLHTAIERFASASVFTKSARRFAHMWSNAGGSAHYYTIPWHVPGNPIGSPHGLDVLMLSATPENWESVLPFHGATWEEIEAAGTDLRRYFAEFAHGTLHPLTKNPRVVRGYAV